MLFKSVVGRVAVLLLVLLPGQIAAAESDQNAIRSVLTEFMNSFNQSRADKVCDIFAADLRYDYRGFPERGFGEICDVLHRSIADPTRHYNYALSIREILVSGDVAIARVVWTLTVTRNSATGPTVTREHSMDLFRRQSDGGWKLIRFTAFEAP